MTVTYRNLKPNRPLQIKPNDWPNLDQSLWTAVWRPVDILSERPPAATWRIGTRKTVGKAYGRWLGWLRDFHHIDGAVPPLERASDERVGAYVAHLRASSSSRTVAGYLQSLTMALKAMHPDANVDRLWEVVNRLQRDAQPVRRKRHRIVPVRKLLAFGEALMTDTSVTDPLMAAVRFRDGLIIYFLAARPIRLRSLQLMGCHLHLIRTESRYILRLAAAETKTGKEIDLRLPAELTPYFDAYFETYRPILLAAAKRKDGNPAHQQPCNALWITRFGTQMAASSLHARIKELTAKHFGKAVNPHLFRDCVATSIALDDPDHIHITMTLLGHTTQATSERYYNHARSRQAVGLQNRMLTDMRRQFRREDSDKAPNLKSTKG